MKKLTLLLAIGLVGFSGFENTLKADDDGGPPGQKKKDGVPPGLQKKGGLPPGQAKKKAKYGQPEESVPATPQAPNAPATPATPSVPTSVKTPPPPAPPALPAPTTPAPPPTPTAKAPDVPKPPTTEAPKPAPKLSKEAQARRAHFEKHVTDLDALGKTPEVRDRMFVRLNRRLDVPLGTMESELKAHPSLGVGGLVAGHYLAKRSKQPVEKILAARESGRSWGEIAGEHKVDLSELNERMVDAKESARAAEREAAKK